MPAGFACRDDREVRVAGLREMSGPGGAVPQGRRHMQQHLDTERAAERRHEGEAAAGGGPGNGELGEDEQCGRPPRGDSVGHGVVTRHRRHTAGHGERRGSHAGPCPVRPMRSKALTRRWYGVARHARASFPGDRPGPCATSTVLPVLVFTPGARRRGQQAEVLPHSSGRRGRDVGGGGGPPAGCLLGLLRDGVARFAVRTSRCRQVGEEAEYHGDRGDRAEDAARPASPRPAVQVAPGRAGPRVGRLPEFTHRPVLVPRDRFALNAGRLCRRSRPLARIGERPGLRERRSFPGGGLPGSGTPYRAFAVGEESVPHLVVDGWSATSLVGCPPAVRRSSGHCPTSRSAAVPGTAADPLAGASGCRRLVPHSVSAVVTPGAGWQPAAGRAPLDHCTVQNEIATGDSYETLTWMPNPFSHSCPVGNSGFARHCSHRHRTARLRRVRRGGHRRGVRKAATAAGGASRNVSGGRHRPTVTRWSTAGPALPGDAGGSGGLDSGRHRGHPFRHGHEHLAAGGRHVGHRLPSGRWSTRGLQRRGAEDRRAGLRAEQARDRAAFRGVHRSPRRPRRGGNLLVLCGNWEPEGRVDLPDGRA